MNIPYAEKAVREFNRLGIEHKGLDAQCYEKSFDEWGWEDFFYLLAATVEIDPRLLQNPVTQKGIQSRPNTAIALRTRELLLWDAVPSFRDNEVDACPEAEYNLLTNISPIDVGNPEYHSPLVFHDEGKAIGILKGLGACTFYGLADYPKHGIIRGAFSEPVYSLPYLYRPPKADHAWELDINKLGLGAFIPRRLGGLLVPVASRIQLMPNTPDEKHRLTLSTSHAYIEESAQLALAGARPLP